MIEGRIQHLRRTLGLPDRDLQSMPFLTVTQHGHTSIAESRAGRALRQIESFLGLHPLKGDQLGVRFKNAEARVAGYAHRSFINGGARTTTASPTFWRNEMRGDDPFKPGDRVQYVGRSTGFRDARMVGALGTVNKMVHSSSGDGLRLVSVLWDERRFNSHDGTPPGAHYLENVELIAAGNPFPPGSRVRINSSLVSTYNGMSGTVVRSNSGGYSVLVDGHPPARHFSLNSLELETPKMTTLVNRVTAAITGFFGTSVPSTTNQAARELLAASTLATIANSRKERAKKRLGTLGVILPEYRPGTVKAFEDSEFRIEAVTKEPAQRLDEQAMRDHMRTVLGLSRAKIDAAFVAARVDNKAATSVVVTEL